MAPEINTYRVWLSNGADNATVPIKRLELNESNFGLGANFLRADIKTVK